MLKVNSKFSVVQFWIFLKLSIFDFLDENPILAPLCRPQPLVASQEIWHHAMQSKVMILKLMNMMIIGVARTILRDIGARLFWQPTFFCKTKKFCGICHQILNLFLCIAKLFVILWHLGSQSLYDFLSINDFQFLFYFIAQWHVCLIFGTTLKFGTFDWNPKYFIKLGLRKL